MDKKIFLELALSRIPQLVSLQDRNPISATYGCFDREYWQYKKTDCPYASLQSGVFSLALLYKNNLPDNIYYRNKKILEWIIAGLKFWSKIQKKGGSFDEYYPNEKSYIGTALCLYPCAEAFNLVKDEIDESSKKMIIRAIDKAANFLSRNNERFVLNQEMLAALGVYVSNRILRKGRYDKAVRAKIDFIIKKQNPEGWFPEYEGCDVGYLSYTIDFIAVYYKKKRDKKVLGALKKAIDFISYFLHPDGTVGGEYTARNTEYLIPHGFSLLNKEIPTAESILSFFSDSLKKDIVSINCLDNRYLPLHLYQYIQTYIDYKAANKKVLLPFEGKEFTKHFDNAGVLVKKIGNAYIIIGLAKGGVIRVYDVKKKKIIYSDCGYIISSDGTKASSAYFDKNRNVLKEDNKLIINGKFCKQKYLKPTKYKHILLRLILTGGILSKIARESIKKTLITKKSLLPIAFKRVIAIDKNNVRITDRVISNEKAAKLILIDKFAYRYIPSSKFFQPQELDGFGVLKFKNLGNLTEISHNIDLKNGRAGHKRVK